jgi:photosystem II stability/assembly factor-like uncharacterized protein
MENGFYGAICFINADVGWLFNSPAQSSSPPEKQQIYKTTNKGVNWFLQYEIDVNICQYVYDRYSANDGMSFINQNTGWLSFGIHTGGCGERSYIHKTTNGGNTWNAVYVEESWGEFTGIWG